MSSSISVISSEYLYAFKLHYRKLLPKTPTFYIFLFLLKYFPLILFTHSTESNTPNQANLFSLSKVISSLLIFTHPHSSSSYIPLCIFLYILLSFLLFLITFLFLSFKSSSKQTDHTQYNIPHSKLRLPSYIKTLMKLTHILYLIIIIFYQHIIEIFYTGIFAMYITSTNPKSLNQNELKTFTYNGIFLIGVLNCVFTFITAALLYMFILFSSTQLISPSYGYQCNISYAHIVIDILLFSLQGVYSSSEAFNEQSKRKYHLIVTYVLICVLLVKLLSGFKQVNYLSMHALPRFFTFMNCFCFISGVVEVLIYHFTPDSHKGDQRYYIITFLFDIVNAYILTAFLIRAQKTITLHNLSANFFHVNKTFNLESLIEFYLDISQMRTSQEKYLYLLHMLQIHQEHCNQETCNCHEYSKLFSVLNNKTSIERTIRKFIELGEQRITDAIINHGGISVNPTFKLLFMHCDYLYSIKRNIPVTLYLCQYYLIKRKHDLNFHYAYLLYEINYLTYKQVIHKYKTKNFFLKSNLIYEKLTKIILSLTTNIEKLFYFKSLKNTNSKLLFTCEDILRPLLQYVTNSKLLTQLVHKYISKRYFDTNAEMKFLLYYFIQLFCFNLPKKDIHKIYCGYFPYPTYQDFEDIIIDECFAIPNGGIVLYLNNDNKFIMRYVSTEVAEMLAFNKKELIDSDFNEMLISKNIASYHNVYMKQWLLFGNTSYCKKTFLLNKDFQIIPVKVEVKVLPTTNTLYAVIVNVQKWENADYKQYFVLLDIWFYLWAISKSFETQFFFSLKMLNSLKINFCEFFGVGKEKVNEYFKNVRIASSNNDNTMMYNKKKDFKILAVTSVKTEELYLYQGMDNEFFKQKGKYTANNVIYSNNNNNNNNGNNNNNNSINDNSPMTTTHKKKKNSKNKTSKFINNNNNNNSPSLQAPINQNNNNELLQYIKLDIVPKEKFVNSIIKLGKNIEELGLETEWKWKLNDLYNKLRSKVTCQDETSPTPHTLSTTKNKTVLINANCFYIQFQFKTIGPIQYYVVTISELREEPTSPIAQLFPQSELNMNNNNNNINPSNNQNEPNTLLQVFPIEKRNTYQSFNDTPSYLIKGDLSSYNVSSMQLLQSGMMNESMKYKENNTHIIFGNSSLQSMNTGVTGGVPFKSKGSIQSKYNELPMSNMSLNGSSSYNNTNTNTNTNYNGMTTSSGAVNTNAFLANNNTNNNNNNTALHKTKSNSSRYSLSKNDDIFSLSYLHRKLFYVKLLKLLESICLIVVFILNIINFVQNETNKNSSLNLFYINTYSFLLSNDIFFGSLACISACLAKDNLQPSANISQLNRKISQSADDVMNHFHLLNSYTNSIINNKHMTNIYKIFHNEEPFSHLLTNWEEREHTSTLIDELYSFHYQLKKFNITINDDVPNNCRLRSKFFKRNWNTATSTRNLNAADDYATDEEIFIYYIASNILTNFSSHMETLTTNTNAILNNENNRSKTFSISINITILIIAVALYVFIVMSIQLAQTIFKQQMKFLFTKHENEDNFYEDLKRFKKLIEFFSSTECNEYTAFKLNAYAYNTTDSNKRVLHFNSYNNNNNNNNNSVTSKSLKTAKTSSPSKYMAHSKHKLKSSFKRRPSSNGISPGKKETEKVENEAMEAKMENTNRQFDKIANAKYAFCSIIVLCVTFIVFFGVEVASILVSDNIHKKLMVENEFATNFFSRGPKFNELLLYAIISVIVNKVEYITRDTNTYGDSVLINYYDIHLDLESNSIFQALGKSYYAYLYYQMHVIRTNIHSFVNDQKLLDYLPETTATEFKFNDKEHFCIDSTAEYLIGYYKDIDLYGFYNALSSEVSMCRKIGNGVNLSGYKTAIDLMLELVNTNYYNFNAGKKETRQEEFLKDSDLKMVMENMMNVIRKLHFADSFSSIRDVNKSYIKGHEVKIVFSIISICFSCGIILGMLLVIVSKLDFYNNFVGQIVELIDKAMRKTIKVNKD